MKMATQLEQATRTLFDPAALHVQNVKLFPGNSRDVSAEQMAEQVNRVLAQLMAGDYEEVEF